MNNKSTINRIVRVTTLLALTFAACSRASANGYYLASDHFTIQQTGSANTNYYYFGTDPNVTASTMAIALADKLGKPVAVVNSLPGETTSYPANTHLLVPSFSSSPSPTGRIRDINASTTLVSDIINGQLRLSGTQILSGVTFNNFVLRVFTAGLTTPGTQFYDVTVKVSSFVSGQGIWSFGQISNSLPIFGAFTNLSSRMQVLTDDKVVIAGLIIGGPGSKQVLIRGVGPSIASFFPAGTILADPTLSLQDGSGAVIATNNNWKDTQQSLIQNTGLAPGDDHESAIFYNLSPGNYTVTLAGNTPAGNGGGTGIGLLEIFDIQGSAQINNLSIRANAGAGDNVLIPGFIIQSPTGGPQFLIRAKGPSLAQFGIADVLQDPTLELHDGSGALIAFNDNWGDTQAADIQATGLAPGNTAESAILTDLAPGNYTAMVRGVNNTTGVALVEIYKREGLIDQDGDGLDDRWEMLNFGNLNQNASGDPDGDKVSNFDEFRRGFNPMSAIDGDGDSLPDDWERFWFGGLGQNGAGDNDNDGLTNAEEFAFGLNPKLSDGSISTPAISSASAISYDASGKLMSVGATTYTYDAEGNIKSGN
jgi:hypothetical protein